MKRLSSPSAARNREPILEVLRRVLPATGTVLEVASGTGEHAICFCAALPALTWQPTDVDRASLDTIEAWRAESGLANLLAPRHLDVNALPWPVDEAAAVVCINMIHVAPWPTCLALLDGAARVLAPGAPLVLYGPYQVGGRHTAPSNEEFDRGLRARDPRWGVRDRDAVAEAAALRGLPLDEIVAMPSNNQSLVFRRAGSAG